MPEAVAPIILLQMMRDREPAPPSDPIDWAPFMDAVIATSAIVVFVFVVVFAIALCHAARDDE